MSTVRADRLRHGNALALNAGGVRAHEALEAGLIALDHLVVRAEAAGGQHDRLRVDRDGVARRALADHADRRAALHQDLLRGRAQAHFNFAIRQILHNELAHGHDLALRVERAVDALDGRAAEAGDARHIRADALEPGNGVRAVFPQGF